MGQISRSHGPKNRRFWTKLSVFGTYIQFEFTDDYEQMHRAWHALLFFEVICQISRSGGPTNRWPGSYFRASGWQLHNEFMDGYEMTNIASGDIKEVPIICRGHLSNFIVIRSEKSIWSSFWITRPVAALPYICLVCFCLSSEHIIWEILCDPWDVHNAVMYTRSQAKYFFTYQGQDFK